MIDSVRVTEKRGSAHKAVTIGHTVLEGLLLFCKSLVGSLLLYPFVMLQNIFKLKSSFTKLKKKKSRGKYVQIVAIISFVSIKLNPHLGLSEQILLRPCWTEDLLR